MNAIVRGFRCFAAARRPSPVVTSTSGLHPPVSFFQRRSAPTKSFVTNNAKISSIFVAQKRFKATNAIPNEKFSKMDVMGRHFEERGQFDEALAAYDLSLKEQPKAFTHASKGVILSMLGRFHEGEECFSEAIKIAPNWDEPHKLRALALVEQGRFEDAERDLKKSIELSGEHDYVSLIKAKLARLRDNNIIEAKRLVEEVLRQNDKFYFAIVELSTIYLMQKDYNNAISVILNAVADQIEINVAWLNHLSKIVGYGTEAQQAMNEECMKKKLTYAYLWQSMIYAKANEFQIELFFQRSDAAYKEEYMTRFYKELGKTDLTTTYKAINQYFKYDFEGAIKATEAALGEPNTTEYYKKLMFIAECYERLRNFQAADEILNKALAIVEMKEPSRPLVDTILGHKVIVLANLGNISDARRIVELHHNTTERNFFYYEVLGHYFFHNGQFDKALECFNTSLNKCVIILRYPILLSKAKVLLAKQDLIEASKTLQLVLNLHPTEPEALKLLAKTYIDLGQAPLALPLINKLLELQPNDAEILKLKYEAQK